MRALLSVYDKAGIVELARGLAGLGWDLVSSGGTAAALRDAGVGVTDTAEITGLPAILGHRVMTLHPKIHGGLLADRDDAGHRADMQAHGIETIDLVVSNLYPFGSDPTAFEHGASGGEDLIDIGGPAMVRAGAKNHRHVGVVVDPGDYEPVLAELQAEGTLSAATRRRLAQKAFATVSRYDAAIAEWLGGEGEDDDGAVDDDPLPAELRIAATREPVTLRYGENPHQRAALYRSHGSDPWWSHLTQHAGMALSYLNLFDADAAWLIAHDLAEATGRPACVVVKHANPCGAAVADRQADAYQRAFDCDPRSAFGGIVAVTEPIDGPTVERMVAAAQADVIIAPAYRTGVVDALVKKRRNTRLLEAPAPTPDNQHMRPVTGGWLVQEPHRFVTPPDEWQAVTRRNPTEAERTDAAFAFRVCGWVKSNAVVLVHDGVAWGIGAGQQSRVEAGEIATAKASGRAAGGACASDAFYPFPDGVEAAALAGVSVVVQPGGGVKDDAVIARADELGLAMLLTGERHFLH